VHANSSCCSGGPNIDNNKVFFSECDRHITNVLVHLKRVPTEKISCTKMGFCCKIVTVWCGSNGKAFQAVNRWTDAFNLVSAGNPVVAKPKHCGVRTLFLFFSTSLYLFCSNVEYKERGQCSRWPSESSRQS